MTGGDWSIVDGASLLPPRLAWLAVLPRTKSQFPSYSNMQASSTALVIRNVICAIVIALNTSFGLASAARLMFVY